MAGVDSTPPPGAVRARASAVLLVALAAAALGLGACGGDEFEDRTAVVRLGEGEQPFTIDACGRDGETVFVVARADDGAIVQAVLGLDDDGAGVAGSSGLTVDADPAGADTRLAAFGAESWARRGGSGAPPGEVTSAALRGSRVQLAGTAVPVDAEDRPVADAASTSFSFDARCDETDDG